MPPRAVEDIVQPIAGQPNSIVAQVSDQRASRPMDCAAARVLPTVGSVGRIYGLGRLSQPIPPTAGMRVIKSGAETGITEGLIRTAPINDEVFIEPIHPLQTICGPGDSGSVWIDATTMSPVAMTCELRNPGGRVFARSLATVLMLLGLRVAID